MFKIKCWKKVMRIHPSHSAPMGDKCVYLSHSILVLSPKTVTKNGCLGAQYGSPSIPPHRFEWVQSSLLVVCTFFFFPPLQSSLEDNMSE